MLPSGEFLTERRIAGQVGAPTAREEVTESLALQTVLGADSARAIGERIAAQTGAKGTATYDATEAATDADVIYMEPVVQADYTKSRDEREQKVGQTPVKYRVTRELLGDRGKSDAIILHSLPRMDELPPDVDDTRHARYWEEAFNGVVLRMALLALVLGAVE